MKGDPPGVRRGRLATLLQGDLGNPSMALQELFDELSTVASEASVAELSGRSFGQPTPLCTELVSCALGAVPRKAGATWGRGLTCVGTSGT